MASAAGATLALALLWWIQPPAPSSLPDFEPVAFEPIRRTSLPPPPPPPEEIHLKVEEEHTTTVEIEDGGVGLGTEELYDRADWRGGAVVECDLRSVAPDQGGFLLDPGGPLTLKSPVDPLSRVVDATSGLIRFTTTEPSGSILASSLLRNNGPLLRLSWEGAEPGTTVSCSQVERTGSSKLVVHLSDPSDPDGPGGPFLLVRACGTAMGVAEGVATLTVEPGLCRVEVERRNLDLPLAINRTAPVYVEIGEGEVVEIELTVPKPPPMWTPPDLDELTTIMDIGSWMGSEAMERGAKMLLDLVLSGEWGEDSAPALLDEFEAELQADHEVPPDDRSGELGWADPSERSR